MGGSAAPHLGARRDAEHAVQVAVEAALEHAPAAARARAAHHGGAAGERGRRQVLLADRHLAGVRAATLTLTLHPCWRAAAALGAARASALCRTGCARRGRGWARSSRHGAGG